MQESTINFNLDPIHSGIRLVTLVTLIIVSVLGGAVIIPILLLPLSNLELPRFLIALVGGVILGVTVSGAVERWLRQIWPSGRGVELIDEELVFSDRNEVLERVIIDTHTSLKTWYFINQRRRNWVPRGWYVTAMIVRDGEGKFASVYTFLKPERAETYKRWGKFELLLSEKNAKNHQEKELVKRQDSLRLNERLRWEMGYEILPEEFFLLLDELGNRLPNRPKKV